MKRQLHTLGAAFGAGLFLTAAALAQGPGGPGGPGGGRQGGMAVGPVTAIDAAAGTLTITSRMTNAAQTLTIAAGTPIVTQTPVLVSDLKVGDMVQVSGVPTGITASQIVVGELPAGFPGQGGNRGGGPGVPQGAAPGANPGPIGIPPASASATAKVTKLEPLTLSLSPGVDLTLKLAANAKVTRITAQTLANIKVGDQIGAMGQTGADGAFTPSAVAVNWPAQQGGGGRGGFGGGPGNGQNNGQAQGNGGVNPNGQRQGQGRDD